MKIAFIGYGKVGAPLADQLQRLGYDVALAAKDPNSDNVKNALAKNRNLAIEEPSVAVKDADIVFLATPFEANKVALHALGRELKGKILIDCTNPVGTNLTHGLNSTQSGSEMIQHLVSDTHVVKAFTIYGYENFENNVYPNYNVKPMMMYCGNDLNAKNIVRKLIAELGWEPLDVGGLEQALHLEHMTLLWVRMVRVMGHSANMVWAHLSR
ncbi:MAG: NADPH-dependent F420 reductase [Plesiomonas shigelloides]